MKKLIRIVFVLALLAALTLPLTAALAEDTTMYVRTGNTGRLHLRTQPSVQAASLGLYANGTPITVHSTQNGWATVTVGGQNGFMLLSCLTAVPPVGPVPTAVPWTVVTPVPTEDTTLYVRTGNTGKLHLREQPTTASRSLGLFPNGTAVQVTARVGNFAFVRVGGLQGYMMLQFLSGSSPAPAPVPGQPTPPPFDPARATTLYVWTGNSGKLHLREATSTSSRSLGLFPNGTAVQAIPLGNGWAQVQVGGLQGYMMMGFLSTVNGGPAPVPSPVPVPSPTPEPGTSPAPAPVAVTMYVATGNSGKLHLRENVSMSSASLGLYPNGTAVSVWNTVGNWCQVTVAGQNGYMMRQFLTTTPPGVVVTPTPAPGTTPAPTPVPGTATVTQPNNSFVNLRSRPHSEEDNVIAQIPSGTVVELLERGDTWCRIRVNGQEGWMISWYLR